MDDPNDPQKVAEALRTRYKENPRAIAIEREAEGVPFLLTPSRQMPMMQAPTSSDAEMQQAMDDVERDLQELTTSSILKDVTQELEGWQAAIRSTMTEGFNSARFALDSHQRDKTFGIRRTLGDYARLSRLVGALSSPVVNVHYRNLAQSIDEVTSVLLVMMGEALANVSFNRSRYLLQVPFSELQARRDSAIYALRNFIGSTQTAYSPNEWPRGVDAYRQLYLFLDNQGQTDLRSLLVENELSRVMDSLINRASQGNVEGLRSLGATAQLDLQRLRRLVLIGKNLQDVNAVTPDAPPLDAFLQAVQLFIDGFEGSGGFRLLRLARPPILFYGLYGTSTNQDSTETRLVRLGFLRNQLAELFDCWLQCGCSPENVLCQIVLDKILYDVDRAIDLYALGTAENLEPEYRAVAYSYLIDAAFKITVNPNNGNCLPAVDPQASPSVPQRISNTLGEVRSLLFSPIDPNHLLTEDLPSLADALPGDPNLETIKQLLQQELKIQGDMESHWLDLVQTMAPSCIPFGNGSNTNMGVFNIMASLLQTALNTALETSNNNNSLTNFRCDPSALFNTPSQYEVSLSAEAEATANISADLDDINEALEISAKSLTEVEDDGGSN